VAPVHRRSTTGIDDRPASGGPFGGGQTRASAWARHDGQAARSGACRRGAIRASARAAEPPRRPNPCVPGERGEPAPTSRGNISSGEASAAGTPDRRGGRAGRRAGEERTGFFIIYFAWI
jgi:hypothetical protein